MNENFIPLSARETIPIPLRNTTWPIPSPISTKSKIFTLPKYAEIEFVNINRQCQNISVLALGFSAMSTLASRWIDSPILQLFSDDYSRPRGKTNSWFAYINWEMSNIFTTKSLFTSRFVGRWGIVGLVLLWASFGLKQFWHLFLSNTFAENFLQANEDDLSAMKLLHFDNPGKNLIVPLRIRDQMHTLNS